MNDDSKIMPGPTMQLPDEAPDQSPTVTRLREGLETKTNELETKTIENTQLRILAGGLFAGSDLYMDDGEIQDNREYPFIDFLRDAPEEIREKIIARARTKMGREEPS
jgi:hypothetical protein